MFEPSQLNDDPEEAFPADQVAQPVAAQDAYGDVALGVECAWPIQTDG